MSLPLPIPEKIEAKLAFAPQDTKQALSILRQKGHLFTHAGGCHEIK